MNPRSTLLTPNEISNLCLIYLISHLSIERMCGSGFVTAQGDTWITMAYVDRSSGFV